MLCNRAKCYSAWRIQGIPVITVHNMKNFDERPHRRGRIFHGWRYNVTTAAAILLSYRYWTMNDLFAAYIPAQTPTQCFSIGWTTPKLPPFRGCGGPRPPSNTWFLDLQESAPSPQTASRSVQPFCTAHPCDTHTHTTLSATSVTIDRICALCIYDAD